MSTARREKRSDSSTCQGTVAVLRPPQPGARSREVLGADALAHGRQLRPGHGVRAGRRKGASPPRGTTLFADSESHHMSSSSCFVAHSYTASHRSLGGLEGQWCKIVDQKRLIVGLVTSAFKFCVDSPGLEWNADDAWWRRVRCSLLPTPPTRTKSGSSASRPCSATTGMNKPR